MVVFKTYGQKIKEEEKQSIKGSTLALSLMIYCGPCLIHDCNKALPFN